MPGGADPTAGWTNLGRRTGRAAAAGSLDSSQPRHVIVLTARDDIHSGEIVLPGGAPGGLLILGRDGDDPISGVANGDTSRASAATTCSSTRRRRPPVRRTGDDRLFGEEGNDELQGGRGRDALSGGPGNDAPTGA